jgi:hypothetical protein
LQAFLVLFLQSFENRTNKGSWKNGIEPTIPIMCFRLVEFKYSTFEIKHVFVKFVDFLQLKCKY